MFVRIKRAKKNRKRERERKKKGVGRHCIASIVCFDYSLSLSMF